jgi:outer membrane protein assembly factor BamB
VKKPLRQDQRMRRWRALILLLVSGIALAAPLALHGYRSKQSAKRIAWKYPSGWGGTTTVLTPAGDLAVLDDHSLTLLGSDGRAHWTVELGNRIVKHANAPVLGSGGEIVIGTEAGLQCFDQQGRQLWQVPGSVAAPRLSIHNDLVYAADQGSVGVYTLGGELVWQRGFADNWFFFAEPLVGSEGQVIVTPTELLVAGQSFNEWLLVLGPDGEVQYKQLLPGRANVQALHDGRMYFGTDAGLLCLTPDGAPGWTALQSTAIRGGIEFDAQGTAFVTSGGKAVAVHAVSSTGQVLWSRSYPHPFPTLLDSSRGKPALLAGVIYVASDRTPAPGTSLLSQLTRRIRGDDLRGGRLMALDASTGQLLWQYNTDESIEGDVTIGTAGNLHVQGNERYLYAIRP